MSPENQIYNRLDRIERKLDYNTDKTQDGFAKVNGRIKDLEEYRAYQEGLDKGLQMGSVKTWGFWKKTALIVSITFGIITLATAFATFVAKLFEVTR